MASSADVRDIMGLSGPSGSSSSGEITKAMILGTDKPKKTAVPAAKAPPGTKRPEGMARELFNLLYNDSKDAPPIIPSDTAAFGPGEKGGYRHVKAKLGMRKVRPWKWMPFTNPARRDGLVLYHWRRAADEGKEYAFAKFNKKLDIPTFNDFEYQTHLKAENWTREQTDHLIDLCRRFDLRFTVIHDRWDRDAHRERSIEDLKERYYGILEKLEAVRPDPARVATGGSKAFSYDAEHERKRKEQLERLYNRTPEQVEEEEMLKNELRKIEARKKERDRKTQDLQKLIAQADSSHRQQDRKGGSSSAQKKKASSSQARSPSKEAGSVDGAGIKFADGKTAGVTLRSQRMKLPQSVGQKKGKAIEQMLDKAGVEPNPMATEDICREFNGLRSDMVLLYELKNALSACEVELQTLKAQYEAVCPGKTLEIPDRLRSGSTAPSFAALASGSGRGERQSSRLSDVIDSGGGQAGQPARKRKAALEQSNVLKKIKNKNY